MLSQEPEIQYIALRNMRLIVTKRPNIFSSTIRPFFCRDSDPMYVKHEKLKLLGMVCGAENSEEILLELRECATEEVCWRLIFLF